MAADINNPHYVYPEGYYPILLAYAFRPFFLLLPIYLVISIVLWGLQWGGVLQLSFTAHIMDWHIYEMLFGLAGAGIAGFLLTAMPEFFEGLKPVVGKPLLALVLLWVSGRIGFWCIDWLGVHLVAVLNLAFYAALLAIATRPIWSDKSGRHTALWWALLMLLGLQMWFFAARLQWVDHHSMSILKASVGAFMILVLLVLRRVSMGVTNGLLETWGADEQFRAPPPRYNLAIFMIIIFSSVEFLSPSNMTLAWLGLATAAALFNLLNDYWQLPLKYLFRQHIFAFWLTIFIAGCGYFLMAIDHFLPDFYGMNHLRHILTTGALGLMYLMIMVIVAEVHTGRNLTANRMLSAAIALIVLATILRAVIPFHLAWMTWLYVLSSVLWALAFVLFWWRYAPYLWQKRVDGLPG